MPIQLSNRVKSPGFSQQFGQHVFAIARKHVTFPKSFSLSVVAVGDSAMRKLNHKYRSVDKVTDVLSFPYDENHGEIVICYPQAVRQAINKQVPLKTELAWLLIHGILHILGYDHEKPTDAKIMRPLEKTILNHV